MADREPKNEQDFLRMQQEAIQRVRSMQERARQTLEDAGVPLEPPPPVQPRQEPSEHLPRVEAASAAYEPSVPPPHEESPPYIAHSASAPEMPFHFALDSEQIMLLLIIYLLYKDQGDQYLMMAVAYLLLT